MWYGLLHGFLSFLAAAAVVGGLDFLDLDRRAVLNNHDGRSGIDFVEGRSHLR
jgi:hypothetical protein